MRGTRPRLHSQRRRGVTSAEQRVPLWLPLLPPSPHPRSPRSLSPVPSWPWPRNVPLATWKARQPLSSPRRCPQQLALGRPRCCHLEPNRWPRGLGASAQSEPETQARRAAPQPRVRPGGSKVLRPVAPAHGGAAAPRGSLWPWPARGQGGALRTVAPQAGLAAPNSETEPQQRHPRPPPRRAGLPAGGRPSRGHGLSWGTTERAGGDGRVGASLAHSTHSPRSHTRLTTHTTHSPRSHT